MRVPVSHAVIGVLLDLGWLAQHESEDRREIGRGIGASSRTSPSIMAGRDASTDIATCGAHTPLMTRSPSAIPVRPLTEDRARVTRPADYLAKAALSMLLSIQDHRFERDPRRAAATLWPGEDEPTQIHLRAATATATTSANTWASQLATVGVADLLSTGRFLRRR